MTKQKQRTHTPAPICPVEHMTGADMDHRTLDKFYTRPDVARACLRIALAHAGARPYHWVEPSAGSGVFWALLPDRKSGMDIAPEHPGIARRDFLTWTPNPAQGPFFLVGNPPFGKNASLAVRFFNHGAQFSDAIAFIVPRTFRKSSLQHRLNPAFHLQEEWLLPLDAFTFQDKPYAVPCVFQVWTRAATPRLLTRPPIAHPDFSFVQAEDACFALQRIGVNAGRLRLDIAATNASSHHYIKTHHPDTMRNFTRLSFDTRWDTSGNPSISKREIVAEYSARLDAQAAGGFAPAPRLLHLPLEI